MCNFFYTECRSCPFGTPCRLYSSYEYCKSYLDAYKGQRVDPPLRDLIVEFKDRNGDLNYQENKIKFRTKPKDRNEQFGMMGCEKHHFYKKEVPSGPKCPYHRRSGLKKKLDKMRVEKYDAEIQQRKENVRLAADDGNRAKQDQRPRDKEQGMEQDSEGCCIVQ